MKKILVTGGAGYVGSVLVPLLLDKGYRVKVYDNLMYGVEGLLSVFDKERFEFIKGSITDRELLSESVKDCDAVIHLAAIVGYPACKKDKRLAMEVNTLGTQYLCEVTEPEVPIIFSSTGSCYGDLEDICDENKPLKPLTIYAESKALAEESLRARGNCVIYRFATGYGISPRMRLDLMINDFVYRAVREKNLIIYEKHFRRTFIHVKDMARAFVFAVENFPKMKDEIYNVGSEDANLTKEQIAELIKKQVPFYYLHYADFGHDEDKRDYEVSYKKIREAGFSVSISVEEGIKNLVNLFKVFKIENRYSNV